jgi:hypothetical protein
VHDTFTYKMNIHIIYIYQTFPPYIYMYKNVGSLIDKVKVGLYSVIIKFRSIDDFFSREEMTTMDHLSKREKISPIMINRFFKPFYQVSVFVYIYIDI